MPDAILPVCQCAPVCQIARRQLAYQPSLQTPSSLPQFIFHPKSSHHTSPRPSPHALGQHTQHAHHSAAAAADGTAGGAPYRCPGKFPACPDMLVVFGSLTLAVSRCLRRQTCLVCLYCTLMANHLRHVLLQARSLRSVVTESTANLVPAPAPAVVSVVSCFRFRV